MRFLVDESVSRDITDFLRSAGHDVVYISETGAGATDEDVLARAAEESRGLITNDKDFGELVFRSGQPHRGVILLRLKDERTPNRLRVMAAVLRLDPSQVAAQFITARDDRLRVRGGTVIRPIEDSQQP
jgi:predicted nuclease of predicted toxin-antitoxin system